MPFCPPAGVEWLERLRYRNSKTINIRLSGIILKIILWPLPGKGITPKPGKIGLTPDLEWEDIQQVIEYAAWLAEEEVCSGLERYVRFPKRKGHVLPCSDSTIHERLTLLITIIRDSDTPSEICLDAGKI